MAVDPIALLGGATALVTGVLGAGSFWSYLKERERRRLAEQQHRETERAVLRTGREGPVAQEAVYTVEKYAVSVVYGDDGHGSITKRWTNVRVKNPVQNLSVPFENWVVCPGGELLAPTVSEDDTSTHTVGLANVMRAAEKVTGSILVSGWLTPETAETFEMTNPFNKGYCLTREECETAYSGAPWKKEYASGSVSVPAKMLELEIRFPPSHRGMRRPEVVVFVGGTETVLSNATEQLRDSLTYEDGIARLVVASPAVGVSYAISWMPPSPGRASK